MRKTETTWEASTITDPRQLIEQVGLQGVTDMLLDRAQDEQSKVVTYLKERGLSTSQADGIDSFYFALMLEACELSIRMGFALAATMAPYEDCEQWLQAALDKAGLRGYRPPKSALFEAPDR